MTLFFRNTEIIILRSRRIASTHRVSMSATFTAMPATIEPASPERTGFINGRPGHTFVGFLDTTYPIREGDKLITLTNSNARDKVYMVKGVNYWQGAGLLDHQELDLVSEDA